MSSVLGEADMPYQAAYCAAKHGLEAMTACLRRELEPYGIKLVSVRPGPVTSDFWGKVTFPMVWYAVLAAKIWQDMQDCSLKKPSCGCGNDASMSVQTSMSSPHFIRPYHVC